MEGDVDTHALKSCWLGLQNALIECGLNLQFFVRRTPETGLRVLALIAIGATLRNRGGKLNAASRRAVIEAMDLGGQLNDRFDGDEYDRDELQKRLLWFAGSSHRVVIRDYARRLRRYERSRPDFEAPLAEIQKYRESVNKVSLATLWALAAGVIVNDAEHEIDHARDLRLVFQMTMLSQIVDDVVDLAEDRRSRLPSFAAGPGADKESLQSAVSFYLYDPEGWQMDRSLYLRVLLRVMGVATRALVSVYSAGGRNTD